MGVSGGRGSHLAGQAVPCRDEKVPGPCSQGTAVASCGFELSRVHLPYQGQWWQALQGPGGAPGRGGNQVLPGVALAMGGAVR